MGNKCIYTGTYNEENDTTTFTIPYVVEADSLNVINSEDGFLLDFTKVDKKITIKGKYTDLIVGLP